MEAWIYLPCGRKRNLWHRLQPPSWDPVYAVATVHKNFYMAGASISRINEERPKKTKEKKRSELRLKFKTSQDVRTRDLSLLFLLCELHCTSLRIALLKSQSVALRRESWEVLWRWRRRLVPKLEGPGTSGMDVEKLGEKADNSAAELSTSWRLATTHARRLQAGAAKPVAKVETRWSGGFGLCDPSKRGAT